MLLCELDDVKALAGIATTADDQLLTTYIERASAALEAHLERELGPRNGETRVFEVAADGPRGGLVVLAPYELRSIVSVTLYPDDAVATTVLAATDYRALPVGGAPGSTNAAPTWTSLALATRPATSALGAPLVEIEGDWGLAATPSVIRHACAQLAAGWSDRAVEEYNLGGETDPRQIRPAATRYGIPAAIRRLVAPYRRWSAG